MDERRIVILGKTGVGKSSLANTIFGEEVFQINHTVNSETSECRAETKPVNGRNITLIDTPGFFDTDQSEDELKSEIVRCIAECAPGPHAVLIVLKVEKFTKQEQAVITKITQSFTEEVFKYATVLFTHGNQLPKDQRIEDFVSKSKLLDELVRKCGGRCHVIDNTYWKINQQDKERWNPFQVEKLLQTIKEITEANNGSCYTNEMLQAMEEGIRQEEERIREAAGNMSQEEIRKMAKDRTVQRWLINLAGVATGALLGALFGVVLMVGVVLNVLTSIAAVAGPVALGGTAGMTVVVGAVAAAGAIKGGLTGYDAAKEANTSRTAAKRAAEAVIDEARSVESVVRSVFEGPDNAAKKKSESQPLIGPDS